MPGETISNILIGLILAAVWLCAGWSILVRMERENDR